MIDEICQKVVTEMLSPMVTAPPVKLAEYADKNFVLVKGETKLADWETLPYQRAILNWLGNYDIGVITIRKSARTGATKMLCVDWAYKTEMLKRDTLFYQPTTDDAKDFKDEEIDGLGACPRSGVLVKIEKFPLNKHNHIHNIVSIILWEIRRVWAKDILGQAPRSLSENRKSDNLSHLQR